MITNLLNPDTFFLMYHFIKNDDLSKVIREYKESQWIPRSELKDKQFEKLEKIISHAYMNVPYYRNMFKKRGIDPLKKFSIDIFKDIDFLYKKDISGQMNKFFALNVPSKSMQKNSTSGSTGRSLVFFNDAQSLSHRQAIVWRNYDWVSCVFSDKQASIWGAPLDAKKAHSLRGWIHSFVSRNILLSSYYLSDDMMYQYVQKLNDFKPKLLLSYPSHLLLFSEFLEKHSLRIPSVKSIITSGETLYPWQREKIESIFGECIFDRYGCREFGNIAHQCETHQYYHVNTERFFWEIVDEQGKSVQEGEAGELVITDLDNYGFPFIRYKIGDVAVPSFDTCPCGRTLDLFQRIEGRTFDIIVGKNGNRLGGTYWTFLMKHLPGIINFQIIQDSLDHLSLKIVKGNNFSHHSLDWILKDIHEKCGDTVTVQTKFVKEIPPTSGGKRRFVISKLQEKKI